MCVLISLSYSPVFCKRQEDRLKWRKKRWNILRKAVQNFLNHQTLFHPQVYSPLHE